MAMSRLRRFTPAATSAGTDVVVGRLAAARSVGSARVRGTWP